MNARILRVPPADFEQEGYFCDEERAFTRAGAVFTRRDDNCILNMSDNVMYKFAAEFLGFRRNKGVDFLAKFGAKYIAGEAKFLTYSL